MGISFGRSSLTRMNAMTCLFPRKLLKWVCLPIMLLVWLPFVGDEIVWQFVKTDAVGDFGVMWLALIAVPATVLCAVPVILIFGARLIKQLRRLP
jgi:hypothetical protein